MATTGPSSSSNAVQRRGQAAPPAVLLNPASFIGALAVFVVGSIIVRLVWPEK